MMIILLQPLLLLLLLLHLTRVFSSDIGMTFSLAKCGRLIVNRGKVKSTCGISLPEGQIDDVDESYKYLGILQSFGNNDEEVTLPDQVCHISG